jgi:hypothetical protein
MTSAPERARPKRALEDRADRAQDAGCRFEVASWNLNRHLREALCLDSSHCANQCGPPRRQPQEGRSLMCRIVGALDVSLRQQPVHQQLNVLARHRPRPRELRDRLRPMTVEVRQDAAASSRQVPLAVYDFSHDFEAVKEVARFVGERSQRRTLRRLRSSTGRTHVVSLLRRSFL